jgi:hypothetical protein
MNESEVAGWEEAGESHGLVTRERARRFLTERQLRTRIENKSLIAVCPRVYRVVGAPVTWMQSLVAVDLWARKKVVFSHRTAAALHGLEGFKEGPVELTVTKAMRIPEGITAHRVEVLLPSDVTEVKDLRVTKLPRTLIDLAAVTDWYALRTAIDQALREKKTTIKELEKAVQRAKHRPGISEIRRMLREFTGDDGPTESVLEDECLDLIDSAGLPRPKVQWTVVAGRTRRRLDLSYEDWGIVIEADGYASHASIEIFEDDRQRNNSLVAGGLRVLHWTWEALQTRPEELIGELCAVINQRH